MVHASLFGHIDGRTSTFHKHPQHEDYLEWIGDSFDPEAFDADKVNRKLRRLK